MVELGLDYRDYFEDILEDQKREAMLSMTTTTTTTTPAYNQTTNSSFVPGLPNFRLYRIFKSIWLLNKKGFLLC